MKWALVFIILGAGNESSSSSIIDFETKQSCEQAKVRYQELGRQEEWLDDVDMFCVEVRPVNDPLDLSKRQV